MEEQKSNNDWREDVQDSAMATLKILDGERVNFVFLDEGKNISHPDYGDSILFKVEHNKEPKRWYVNPNNFGLLKSIKDLGTLTGTAVTLSRTGSKKSDTRYTLEKVNTSETVEVVKPGEENKVSTAEPSEAPEVPKSE